MQREQQLISELTVAFEKLLSEKNTSVFSQEVFQLRIGNEDIFNNAVNKVTLNYVDRVIDLISEEMVDYSEFSKEQWKSFYRKDFEEKMQTMLIAHPPLQKTIEPKSVT